MNKFLSLLFAAVVSVSAFATATDDFVAAVTKVECSDADESGNMTYRIFLDNASHTVELGSFIYFYDYGNYVEGDNVDFSYTNGVIDLVFLGDPVTYDPDEEITLEFMSGMFVFDGEELDDFTLTAYYTEELSPIPSTPTAIDQNTVATPVTRTIENGQIVIRKGNQSYSILGTAL